MDHCLSQIFGVPLSRARGLGETVSRPVVLHYRRMMDREIGDTLFEPAGRIAPHGHHFVDELIGVRDRPHGVVHEARLDAAPSSGETRTIRLAELVKTEVLHPPRPCSELPFCSCRAPILANCPFVLGPKLSPELGAAQTGLTPADDHRGAKHAENYQDRDEGP